MYHCPIWTAPVCGNYIDYCWFCISGRPFKQINICNKLCNQWAWIVSSARVPYLENDLTLILGKIKNKILWVKLKFRCNYSISWFRYEMSSISLITAVMHVCLTSLWIDTIWKWMLRNHQQRRLLLCSLCMIVEQRRKINLILSWAAPLWPLEDGGRTCV